MTSKQQTKESKLDLERCKSCCFYAEEVIFETCKHSDSLYTADGKKGFHTILHMRLNGCGSNASLHTYKKPE